MPEFSLIKSDSLVVDCELKSCLFDKSSRKTHNADRSFINRGLITEWGGVGNANFTHIALAKVHSHTTYTTYSTFRPNSK